MSLPVAATCQPQRYWRGVHSREQLMVRQPGSLHQGSSGWQPFSSAPPRRAAVERGVVTCAFKGFCKKPAEDKPIETKACPCGSKLHYEDCCKRYHDAAALPETAEALMRSRYSAYAKGLVDYIVRTTHPDNPLKPGQPGSTLEADARATCDKISWEKLKVLEAADGETPDEAWVTFQTWFKVRKQIGQRTKGWHTQSFVEKSRFLRDPERGWLYVDGEQSWDQPENRPEVKTPQMLLKKKR